MSVAHERPAGALVPDQVSVSGKHVFVIHRSEAECAFFRDLARDAQIYSEGQLRIRRWIPDFVLLEQRADGGGYILRLIEVEPTLDEALQAGRKFIPESWKDIVQQFRKYLKQLRSASRKSFNSQREQEIAFLERELESNSLEVRTAAGVRSRPGLVEDLRVADQDAPVVLGAVEARPAQENISERIVDGFGRDGICRLFRAVLALDAAVLQEDRSESFLKKWCTRRGATLKGELIKQGAGKSVLYELLTADKLHGRRIDWEGLIQQLVKRWDCYGKWVEADVASDLLLRIYEMVKKVHYSERIQFLLAKIRPLLEGKVSVSPDFFDRPILESHDIGAQAS